MYNELVLLSSSHLRRILSPPSEANLGNSSTESFSITPYHVIIATIVALIALYLFSWIGNVRIFSVIKSTPVIVLPSPLDAIEIC